MSAAPAKRFVLVLGGARSGKSDLALKLARSMGERVLFVATAEAGDDEMQQRIEAHQRERPPHWTTLEASHHIADRLEQAARDAQVVVLDCVTLWVANLLGSVPESADGTQLAAATQGVLAQELGALHDWYRGSNASLIVVSNEVGMGLVPPYPAGRAYRDLLGWANQRLATMATEVYMVIAGIPVDLKQISARLWQDQD